MAESNVAAAPKETQQSAKPTRKGSLLSRVAYSFGNVGQSAFYNALSTYFIVYVTSSLFSGVDKALATKLIGVITGLVVVIRIAEIFIDPLLGNIVDNTNTKWGRFKPWQLIGGTVSAVLLVLVYTGLFGLVNVNTTLFIVLFVITFIVLDVFYSLRDISYWATAPTMPLEQAPAILSSIGRTDRVTASLRLPFFSWPYSMESVRERMAVIWIKVCGR